MFPSRHKVNYKALLAAAEGEGVTSVARFLLERLPLEWRDVYLSTAGHQANLVHLRCGTFEYICDLYSQLEASGEVGINQTIQDRVVAVLGTSACAARERNGGRGRSWGESTEAVGERDQGHFMAHCIGGRLEVNVFSQERSLNRGWSAQGKIYRRMETYCYEQPGTFCFSRPIYADGSCIPRWLEFGLLKADQTLWVEVFDN